MTHHKQQTLPTLTVCIPTYGPEGIQDVAKQKLPMGDGIDYVVSWQEGGDGEIPKALLSRPDIHIFKLKGKGVSANRNNAMRHARGEVLMIADDDIDYKPEWLQTVRESFALHPEAQFILFQMQSLVQKDYPCKVPTRITKKLPKGHYATSCELSIRRSVFERGIMFDDRFGINAPKFTLGEDSLLVIQMMRMGIEGRYEPKIVCFNNDTTSGQRTFKDPRQSRSTGVLITWEKPVTGIPRILLKAIRMQRARQGNFFAVLFHMLQGAAWGYTHQPPWRKRKIKD